jgi:hypothetical protein
MGCMNPFPIDYDPPDPSVRLAMVRCWRQASRLSDEMRFFSPHYGGQLPGCTIIPDDYLFVKADKPNRTLQFLLRFLKSRDRPILEKRKIICFTLDWYELPCCSLESEKASSTIFFQEYPRRSCFHHP